MKEIDPTDTDIETIEPVEPDSTITQEESDSFWEEDALEDERYSGDGIPSWSVWAE